MDLLDKCLVLLAERRPGVPADASAIAYSVLDVPDRGGSAEPANGSPGVEANNNHLPDRKLALTLDLFRPEQVHSGQLAAFLPGYFAKPVGALLPVELHSVLAQLRLSVASLQTLAVAHDLEPGNQSNGFRTLLKINAIAAQALLETLAKSKSLKARPLRRLLYLHRLLLLLDQMQLSLYRLNRELQGPSGANVYHPMLALLVMELYQAITPHMQPYYAHHLVFYLPPHLVKCFRVVARAAVGIGSMPFSLGSLFSGRSHGRRAVHTLREPTMSWPLSLFSTLDDLPFRKLAVNVYHRSAPVKVSTYFLPKQRQWRLSELEVMAAGGQPFHFQPEPAAGDRRKVIKSHKFGRKPDTVRVRVMRHQSHPPDGSVLFHCHGGAFIFHSPDCHEMYLRGWVRDQPACTIFSVDYELRQEFPRAQQDALDAYAWLTSGSEQVEQVLGFRPTRVVVAGDSAGAFMVYTLCLMLTDMREYAQRAQLPPPPPMPHAIVSVYGFYSLNNAGPMMVNYFLDLLLPPSIIRIAFGSLIKGCDHPRFHKHLWCHCCLPKRRTWYDEEGDPRTVNAEFMAIVDNCFYLSSLLKYDFSRIQIPLFMISSEFDVCLDHNIELARRWKGKGTLDVVENLPHGFLQLNFVDSMSDKACQLVLKRIKEAFAD